MRDIMTCTKTLICRANRNYAVLGIFALSRKMKIVSLAYG